MILESEQYPIGPCPYQEVYSQADLARMILDIETFPMRLEHAVQGLLEFQLHTPYRDGGWTINQVIHHCADSHMNALIRIKLALSCDNPSINPYPEDLWAMMPDYDLPFNNSTTLLFAIHKKLNVLLRSLTDAQLERTYYHSEYKRTFRISDVICLYAWHGNHHLAHVQLGIAKSR